MTFDGTRCQHAAECLHGLPRVFDYDARPWINADGAEPEAIAEVVQRCPSGALQYHLADGPEEEGLEPTVMRRSPAGRIYVRGSFVVRRSGTAVTETRAILCGCGASVHQPYCDRSGACRDEPVRRFLP